MATRMETGYWFEIDGNHVLLTDTTDDGVAAGIAFTLYATGTSRVVVWAVATDGTRRLVSALAPVGERVAG